MSKRKVFSGSVVWEKIYPLVLSILLLILFLLNQNYLWIKIDLQELIRNSLNLFGILLGFLITVLTIINSLDNIYIRKLRKVDSFQDLIGYLKLAIKSNVLILVFAIFFLSIKINYQSIQILLDYTAVFIFSLTLFTTYRFIDIFLYIINTEKN